MKPQLVGGIMVMVFVVVGWLAATYFIAHRAKGKRERRFMLRAGVASLLGILAFSVFDGFVLKSSGAAVGGLLFFTFLVLRRKQLGIRCEEIANN